MGNAFNQWRMVARNLTGSAGGVKGGQAAWRRWFSQRTRCSLYATGGQETYFQVIMKDGVVVRNIL